MSEQDVRQGVEEQPSPRPGSRRRFLAGALTGGILGSLLAGSISVYSQVHHRPGWWSHAGAGSWFGHRQVHDPELMGERIGFATDWFLSRINAGEEQRQQVKTIVQEAWHDLLPVREQHLAQRQAWLEALQQPRIDRQTLEELRQAKLYLAETASSRLVEALAEIAEVLTPEQRAELTAFVARWHH